MRLKTRLTGALPALPLLLLAACSSLKAPPELVAYLSNCDIDKARDYVETAELAYTAVTKDGSGAVIGTSTITYTLDQRSEDDLFTFFKSSYTGTFVETDSSGFSLEQSMIVRRVSLTDANIYVEESWANGVGKDPAELPLSTMQGKITMFFYNTMIEDVYKDGLYYADTLRSSLKFYEFMSIDDNNNFVYNIENVGSLNGDGELESIMNETFYMNEYGLLFDFAHEIRVLTDNTVTTAHLTVDYNRSDFSRPETAYTGE